MVWKYAIHFQNMTHMWILTPKLNRNLEKKITVTNEIKFVDGSEKKNWNEVVKSDIV